MGMEKFREIYAYYSRRKSGLLLSGKSQRPTKLGYWASSNPMDIFELFKKIELNNYKSFVDLGSGDGIVAAIASLFARSAGIEIDNLLHKDACEMMKTLKLDCSIKNADYLDEDLSQFDFIFMNPDNYFHRLEKKLVEEFSGMLVIADSIFQPLTLIASEKISVRGSSFSVYRIGSQRKVDK